jgi:putative SOS response-associated peptidase YedK
MSAAAWCPLAASYEWHKTPAVKIPYYITSAEETLLAFAGLWDNWRKPDACD